MTVMSYAALVEVVGDGEFVRVLVERGILVQQDTGYHPSDVDRALACLTLVRELEVNWPGVEIILRLREELAHARAELADRRPRDGF